MKRDDDFLRELLLEFEQQDDWLVLVSLSMSSTPEDRRRYYHTNLLCDAGLMTRVANSAFRTTSQGHDYLDAIRNDGIWQKTKSVVAETGGSATLEFLKLIALGFAKKKIEEYTGIAL